MQITIDTREQLSPTQALRLASLLADQDLFVGTQGPPEGQAPCSVTLTDYTPEPVVVPPLEPISQPIDAAPDPVPCDPVDPVPCEPVDPVANPATPKKRKRRTKAQIAADKRQKAADQAILDAAKTPAVQVCPPEAAASELAVTPAVVPAAAPEESTPSHTGGALSTGDMKAVVGAALERLTEQGDSNAAKTVVGYLIETTGKKRISEIGAESYPSIAAGLNDLEVPVDPLA